MLVNVAKLKNDFVTIWSLDVIGHVWLIRYFGSNHIWHLWDSWFSSSPSFWVSLRNYDFILKVVKWLSLSGGWLVDVWGAVHSHVKVNVCRKHNLKASWWMQCGFHMSSLHISQRFGMISPDPLVKHIANPPKYFFWRIFCEKGGNTILTFLPGKSHSRSNGMCHTVIQGFNWIRIQNAK